MTYDNNACYVEHALLLNSAFLSTFVAIKQALIRPCQQYRVVLKILFLEFCYSEM